MVFNADGSVNIFGGDDATDTDYSAPVSSGIDFSGVGGSTNSGTPNNVSTSSEGAFSLGSLVNDFFTTADKVLPAYFQADAAKSAAKAAAPAAGILALLIGGVVVILLLRRK